MLQLPLQSSDVSVALWEPLPAEGETEMVARPGHSPKEMIGADSACDCTFVAYLWRGFWKERVRHKVMRGNWREGENGGDWTCAGTM